MSVCSKILLQINAKLGGALYTIQKDKALKGKKIMIVGVDSSKHKDKNNYGTGIAMVATINDTFTDFYNKVEIVKRERPNKKIEQKKEQYIEDDEGNENSEETSEESKKELEGKYEEKFSKNKSIKIPHHGNLKTKRALTKISIKMSSRSMR